MLDLRESGRPAGTLKEHNYDLRQLGSCHNSVSGVSRSQEVVCGLYLLSIGAPSIITRLSMVSCADDPVLKTLRSEDYEFEASLRNREKLLQSSKPAQEQAQTRMAKPRACTVLL